MSRKRRSDQLSLPGLGDAPAPRATAGLRNTRPRSAPDSRALLPASARRTDAPEREPTQVVAAEIRHADRPSGERRALGVLAARLAEIAADLHLADQLSAERPAAAALRGGEDSR
jgi:hypothetical protein